MAGRTTLGQLREQAQPWLSRPARRPADGPVVDSPDRADLAVWDKIRSESALLRKLESRLAKDYGVEGLTGDVWMAVYARSPQLLGPDEVTPRQRSRRAVAAAMLGTAEYRELRASTAGDAYASALAVLSMGTDLQLMLSALDEKKAGKAERQARRETDRRGKDVRDRFKKAQASAAEDADEDSGAGRDGAAGDADRDEAGPGDGGGQGGPDGPGETAGVAARRDPEAAAVPRPEAVDVQRAVTEAQAAEQDEAAALAALAATGEGDEAGEQAAMAVRATARESLAAAAEDVAAQQTAMAGWGLGTQVQERLDPDARLELAKSLNTPQLKMFAEMIGRFAQLARAQRARRVEHARGEYVGVSIGDDLGSLIPAELVNLAVPALRASFAARYAEQQLMIYEQRGDDHEGQGAIIACVDVSGSMSRVDYLTGYSAEAYAKAMALALLDQARAALPVRDCVVILFAGTVADVFRFPADRPVDQLDRVRLAAAPLAGGTEFTEPLRLAVQLLDEEFNTVGRQRGDVVFVTDGQYRLQEEFLEWWRPEKRRLGFRCFGVLIEEVRRPWRRVYEQGEADDVAASVLGTFCDDVRSIADLSDVHATADIYRAV